MRDIDIEFKNAWLRQLREDWKNANYNNFKDRMRLPDIDLSSSKITLGKWEGAPKRKLFISEFLIQKYPWQHVQEVLYHEMAHQYVEEVLKITNELPHGEAFKKVCYENGFDHRASEKVKDQINVQNNAKGYSRKYKILDKVRKLLSLAQSTNQHEAESAMAKARELLLRHNISLLETEINKEYEYKQIGEVGNRNPVKSIIGTIINKFFFVETLWVLGYNQMLNKRGRVLEIYGSIENIEMAEYVHDYLHNVSRILWNEYKVQKNIKGNTHRRSYVYGLLNGFYEKLELKNVENSSKNLVWIGDPELKKYYRRRNPKIETSNSRYSRSCQEAYNSGITRGKNLVIHKGISRGSSGKVRFLN